MTEAEFAQAMVNKYRGLLLACAGMKSITIDGQSVSYDDLDAKYREWKQKLEALTGKRPRVAQIDLGNG